MKNEKMWKANMVLWSVVLVASIVGISVWGKKYFTTGEVEGLPIFFFLCSLFSAVIWMIVYRREKKKEE
ncbi:MAG: hypothetical protein IJB63_02030 [Alistipes sp.]|nr:hypothetical protein [Alistipes sp.]